MFEDVYGHHFLSAVLLSPNLLAYLLHTVLELSDPSISKSVANSARAKLSSMTSVP